MLETRSEESGDGPLAVGPGRIVRLAPRQPDRGLVVALIPAHNAIRQAAPITQPKGGPFGG
jgi:hypothetical protein